MPFADIGDSFDFSGKGQARISPRLAVVIPCYNEREVLPLTIESLSELLKKLISDGQISESSCVYFVDDGSVDGTWNLIADAVRKGSGFFHGVKLARNYGHQKALYAGLVFVRDKCDISISLDADLQDDLSVIPEMIRKYVAGAEIVYGVRNDRSSDSRFKRTSAKLFYSIMGGLGVKMIPDCADFRLMSAAALASLSEYREANLFLRGIVPDMGYLSDTVSYSRLERKAGESKYSLGKMMGLAVDGVTSFSVAPLRLIAILGIVVFVLAVFAGIFVLVSHFKGNTVPGWSTLALSIWGLGGLQLVALGVVGEYIGKVYLETKCRPRFIIEKYQ